MGSALILPVLTPLLAALAALIAPRRGAGFIHGAGIAAILGTVAHLVLRVGEGQLLVHDLGGWSPPLGIALRADGVSAAMLSLSALVFALVSAYARLWPGPFEAAGRMGRPLFWPIWFLLWGSINALFLSGDVFNLYVCLELVTLAAAALVAQGGSAEILAAALRYLVFALFGALLFLLGVALLYAQTGVLDLALLAETIEPGLATTLAAALMTVGLLMKAAVFPLHFWLPPAHAGAAAPVSAALSALVIKAAFFLLLRLWSEPFLAVSEVFLPGILGALGAAAILWGGLQACMQSRLKLLVAYSTAAQIGYLMLLFPLFAAAPQAAWGGAIFQALAHGLAKAAAFLAAGNILLAVGDDRIDSIRGIRTELRMSLMAFALAGVSLAGLPPFGGFVAKWLLLDAALSTGQWVWGAFLVIGGLITAAYVARVLSAAMATPEPGAETVVRPIPRGLEVLALILALAALVLGLAAGPVLELISVGGPFEIAPPPERIRSIGAWLPIGILLSSAACGVVIFFLAEAQARLRMTLNLLGAGLKVTLVLALLWRVYDGAVHEARLAFLPGIDLVLRADPLSLQFITLSAGLWLLTTIYAIGYLEESPDRSRFFGFFSLSVTASTGIALSGNLMTLLFFYELLTIATYPLVVHRGGPKALTAGRIYLGYTIIGGVAVLLGTVLLHVIGGPLEFEAANDLTGLFAERPAAVSVVFALLIGGFATKAAMVPLHGWLPVAMVAPAPVSALLHAVAVVKAGVFGIIRVIYDIFGVTFSHAFAGTQVLLAVAVITILYGSIQALRQDELKRRLAFSTISQLSYIALGAALASPVATVGALVHLVHQGVMKITLFFCAGNLAEAYNISRVSQMAGVGRLMPVTMAAFTAAALGMIGLPPLAGFVSKWYLAGGGTDAGQGWVMYMLVASSLLNAAYFLPILHAAWFQPLGDVPERLRDAGWWLLLPPVATALITVGAGFLAASPLSPLGWAEVVAERVYFGRVPEP